MALYKHDGTVMHVVDCTWCHFKMDIWRGTKRKGRNVEKCMKHGYLLAPPGHADRKCDEFIRKGCDCAQCGPITLDKT